MVKAQRHPEVVVGAAIPLVLGSVLAARHGALHPADTNRGVGLSAADGHGAAGMFECHCSRSARL